MLLASAERKENRQWPDRYLGAGTLKAYEAVTKWDFSKVKALGDPDAKAKGIIQQLDFKMAPEDFYDGQRSFLSLFGFADDIAYNNRADLNQLKLLNQTREESLSRLLYNTLLLEKWHSDHLPVGDPNHYHLSKEISDESAKIAKQKIMECP